MLFSMVRSGWALYVDIDDWLLSSDPSLRVNRRQFIITFYTLPIGSEMILKEEV